MARILRGDIYWADLNPVIGSEQGGSRPVLILRNERFNKHSGTVIAVAITSQPQRAGFPLTLELDSPELSKQSWVKISQIRTLSVKRIREKLCTISAEQVNLVVEGLNEIIGE
jgi:mRNA interferase MazF